MIGSNLRLPPRLLLLLLLLATTPAGAAHARDDPPPVSAADFLDTKPPEEIAMPPEESVPERRDLPPLPLPPLVNSQKEYPVPAKRLFVEDARENPPLPVVPRGEEALAGGAAEEEENAPDFHSARPDEAVFRLSHLDGEDEEAGSEGGEGDRVGLIPPRLRAFRRAQKSWRGIKDLLQKTAKLEEKEEDEAIAESRKRLEAALKSGDEATIAEEENKLGSEGGQGGGGGSGGGEAGSEGGQEEGGAEGEASDQGAQVPTRGEVAAAAAQRIQDAVDRRISMDSPQF